MSGYNDSSSDHSPGHSFMGSFLPPLHVNTVIPATGLQGQQRYDPPFCGRGKALCGAQLRPPSSGEGLARSLRKLPLPRSWLSVRGTDTGDAVTPTQGNSEGPSQLWGAPCSWLRPLWGHLWGHITAQRLVCPLLLPVLPQGLILRGRG